MKHKWKLDEYGKPDEWAWESGFHNGVYCEDCGETVCIHCDSDWFEWDDCPGPSERKSRTNADYIRGMNDEELVALVRALARVDDCPVPGDPDCAQCIFKGLCESIDGYSGRELEWLKRPVQEVGVLVLMTQ